MQPRRPLFALLAFATGTAALACSGSAAPPAPTTSTTVTGPPAALVLRITPNPIVEDAACLCGGLPNRVSATGTLSITETAGVGVRVDGLRATLRNNATGATTFTNDFTAADVAGHASGANRVAGGGALDVRDVGGHYDRGVRGAATMTIELRATDDRGNGVSATLSVRVEP